MLRRRLSVDAGVIFGSEGVDETSETFHLFRNLPSRSFCGSLKKKMFQKVRNSAELLGFMATAHRDPDADAHTFHLGHLARGDPDSVFQARCPVQHSTFRPS